MCRLCAEALYIFLPFSYHSDSCFSSIVFVMPPIWGEKYLERLGLESWEQAEKLAEQALQEKAREWDAEAELRRNQNTAQRHTPVS